MYGVSKDSSSTCSIHSFDESQHEDVDAAISTAWRSEKLEAIARRWTLTEREQAQLVELRDRLQDVRHRKNDPEDVVRFLREARSVKGAERMFRRFIKWRINHVDTILEDYHPDPVLKSHFPMTLLNGVDKDEDLLWVERPGATDCFGLYQRFGREELMRYCVWVREAACHSSRKQAYVAEKNQAPRMTCIVDLKGLNRSHVRPVLLPVLAEIVQDIQNYYCGFIKKIIVIREPPIFGLVWSMVKHCFNANMRELMVFAGSNYIEVLKDYIDDLEGNLPPCLLEGATGTIADGMPQRMDGGPLPPKDSHDVTSDEDTHAATKKTNARSFVPSPSPRIQFSEQGYGCGVQMNIQLDRMSDHESMAVRCHLLAKGAF